MRKWRGRMGAKIGAWIGITLSGCIFLGSILGILAMEEGNVYDYSREELRKKAYETVADHYAIRALDNMKNPENNKFLDTYFRYGIIKADKIENLDFNNGKIYVERNFTEEIKADELYINDYSVGSGTKFFYSGTLFGRYGVSQSFPTYLVNAPVYAICYNLEDGVFYYDTSGEYYPVRTVEIGRLDGAGQMESYAFSYDFARGIYRNLGRTSAPESGGDSAAGGAESLKMTEYAVASQPAGESEDTAMEKAVAGQSMGGVELAAEKESAWGVEAEDVLRQEYISFDMLDSTVGNYADWNFLRLDGVERNFDFFSKPGKTQEDFAMDRVQLIDNLYMAGKPMTQDTDYELAENDILHVNRTDGEGMLETYWVVAILPESVGFGWSQDLFVQANMLVMLAYNLRYSIYLVLMAALGLMLFCFVFLIRAAGCRRDSEETVATWLDRMPFDLYLGFVWLGEVFLFVIAREAGYHTHRFAGIMAVGFLLVCMCWLALLTILTFAVRVKLGKWWENTLVWWVLHGIYRGCLAIIRNIGLIYRAAILLAGIFMVELLVIVREGSGHLVNFWFMEKLVLTPVIFFAILQVQRLKKGGEKLAEGDLGHRVDTEKMFWEFKRHGENLNSISMGMSRAVDERMKSERFKTELITNVSHDIKTPLTSIINYVDLLEKEDLQNESAKEYLEVLERQSARLKKLIEDLMEASKASTGNLPVKLEKLEAGVSMVQTVGEFDEKMRANALELLIKKPKEPVYIMADGRHFWRVIDNLMNNICKYAQPNTRVYINMEKNEENVQLIFRNTSRYPLNINSDELMERFVRGDSSRNTEGSGLGLSIANSLMELMGGSFHLYVDGDLFKVVLEFPAIVEK